MTSKESWRAASCILPVVSLALVVMVPIHPRGTVAVDIYEKPMKSLSGKKGESPSAAGAPRPANLWPGPAPGRHPRRCRTRL